MMNNEENEQGGPEEAAAPAGPSVQLYTATWARESHGLFDYEARHPIKKQFEIHSPTTISRKDTEVTVGSPHQPGENNEPLARLVLRGGKFCVDAARVGESGRLKSGKLWRVVKDLQNGYGLQENDSIKLGRFKLRVRQIVSGDPHNPNNEPLCAAVNPPSLPPKPCNTSPEKLAELENTPCRICLLEGSSVDDPLIRPCDCKGTIEYVHLGCLRHWVRGKLDLAESQSGTYFYKPMSCELCKSQYATHLQEENDPSSTFPLIELPKTTPPFIVLERDSNRPELKGVHVISLAEKKLLKLGRGHESDVRFADVSISRWHATVHYDGDKNSFILTDHNSKFGTLVAIRTPVPLELSTSLLSLQAGRTVLQFCLRRPGQGGAPPMLGAASNFVGENQHQHPPGENLRHHHQFCARSEGGHVEDFVPMTINSMLQNGHGFAQIFRNAEDIEGGSSVQHEAPAPSGMHGFPPAPIDFPTNGNDEHDMLLRMRLSLLSHNNQGAGSGEMITSSPFATGAFFDADGNPQYSPRNDDSMGL